MSAARPLLHIGYMKTGSTWLQRHVTSNKTAGLQTIVAREDLTERLVRPSVLAYDVEDVRTLVTGSLQECERRGLVPVISHERLSGNPTSGGFDSTTLADRLYDLFPDARIVIVIREQRSFLASFYNEYVCGGGASSLNRFLRPPPGAKLPLFDASVLEYHRLIAYYSRLFGQENVLVLTFESFARDRLAFSNRIITFAGGLPLASVPVETTRRSRSWTLLGPQRWLNFALYRDSSNPAAPVRIPRLNRAIDVASHVVPAPLDRRSKRRAARTISAFVGRRYAESNRLTQAYISEPLGKLGYDLEDEPVAVPSPPVLEAAL